MIVGFSLPGATIATLTGGFLFATFPGALFNVIGATIGATAIFLAARWGLGEKLAAKMDSSGGAVKKIKARHRRQPVVDALFLIRLVPAVPFFLANLIPAFVGVPLFRFVVSTFFGIIPGSVVYTSVGAGLGEVFARGETPNLGIIFEPADSVANSRPVRSGGPSYCHQGRARQERSVNMTRIKTDICIIGGGSGGLSIAAGAVQMGAKVVLLEGHKMGGDCLNYGCVPSKALIASAKQRMPCRKAQIRRRDAAAQVDYAAAKDHVARCDRHNRARR